MVFVVFSYRTIAYSVSKTRFFVGKPSFLPVVRELPITNTFGFTMIVYDAQFPTEVQDVFSVSFDIVVKLIQGKYIKQLDFFKLKYILLSNWYFFFTGC